VTARDTILARFQRETAHHRMTVLHDDGLYRHLHFQQYEWRPPLVRPVTSSMYWFDLITVPGALIFRGDGESFVFARDTDMFEFFRGPVGQINASYWAEKLTSHRDGVMRYDVDIYEATVKEAFVDAVRGGDAPPGLGMAVRRDLLESYDYFTGYEDGARQALDAFEFKGFRFESTYEWNLRDYDWWFLWALHGIVWGIAQYDAAKAAAAPAVAA
jgi:hypothetical protein